VPHRRQHRHVCIDRQLQGRPGSHAGTAGEAWAVTTQSVPTSENSVTFPVPPIYLMVFFKPCITSSMPCLFVGDPSFSRNAALNAPPILGNGASLEGAPRRTRHFLKLSWRNPRGDWHHPNEIHGALRDQRSERTVVGSHRISHVFGYNLARGRTGYHR